MRGLGRASLSIAIVAAIAVISGIMVAAIVDAVDPLRASVAVALASIDQKTVDGLDLVIVDDPPTGAARGLQLALLGVLAGGMPAAFIGMGLAARTRRVGGHWRAGWGQVFQAGFVFQFSSLVVTTYIFLGIIVATAVADVRQMSSLAGLVAGMLFSSVLSSAFGIRSWRRLRMAVVPDTVPRITP